MSGNTASRILSIGDRQNTYLCAKGEKGRDQKCGKARLQKCCQTEGRAGFLRSFVIL